MNDDLPQNTPTAATTDTAFMLHLRSHSVALMLTSLLLAVGCSDSGDNNTPSSSGPAIGDGLPPIVIGEANPISYAEGEFNNAFAALDDDADNRWLVADRSQGILGIDKDTQAVTVLLPVATVDEIVDSENLANDALIAITDIALDAESRILYILDARSKQVLSFDLASNSVSVVAVSDDFDGLDESFAWAAPRSITFDASTQQLFIGDILGFTETRDDGSTDTAFALFAYDPASQTKRIVAAEANKASPLFLLDVRDITMDEDGTHLFAGGFLRNPNNNSAFYTVYRIELSSWENDILYIDNDASSATTSLHAIAFSARHNVIFSVNSGENRILALELDSIDDANPTVAVGTLLEFGDDKAYPLVRPSFLTLINDELVAFDESFRAAFVVNTQNLDELFVASSSSNNSNSSASASSSSTASTLGNRELLFSGIPLREENLNYPFRPADITILSDGDLVATDNLGLQRDALIVSGNTASPWTFNTDMSGINPTETSSSEPFDELTITAAKPYLIGHNLANGDEVVYAFGYDQATDDPLTINSYRAALYRKASNENTFKPVSITENNGNEELAPLSFFFSGGNLNTAFATRYIAAAEHGIYLAIEVAESSWDIWYWNYAESSLARLDVTASPYNPVNLTGMAYDSKTQRLLYTDATHDSLIAIDASDEHSEPAENSPVVVTGRSVSQEGWVYISSPTGLAVNADSTMAYTFDSTIRALVAIDLASGARTRLDSDVNFAVAAFDLALSNDDSELYMIERNTSRLLVIDLTTLEQRWLDRAPDE